MEPDQDTWSKFATVNAIALPTTAMIPESEADPLRVAVLSDGNVTFPAGGGTLFAGIFERKFANHDPMFVFITTAPKEAAMNGDPNGIECVGRLFDEPELAAQPGFKAAWIGFLRAYNVFQFLPQAFFVTSRGLEENAYATLTDAINRKSDPKATADSPELNELLELTVPEVRSLLLLISSEGLPLPEPGYELPGASGEVVATVELAWPQFKIALYLESEVHSEPAFLEANWTMQSIATVQTNPQQFIARLRQANHQGGINAH